MPADKVAAEFFRNSCRKKQMSAEFFWNILENFYANFFYNLNFTFQILFLQPNQGAVFHDWFLLLFEFVYLPPNHVVSKWQGNLLRGIVNWSDAAQSDVQGPKQSLWQQFHLQLFFISTWNKKHFLQTMLAIHGFHSENYF